MKCAIYARYSTENQNEESIESQITQCRALIEREGWTIPDGHIYSDFAISGSTIERPGLKMLLATAKKRPRPFDRVVVFAKSRLSRSSLDDLTITRELESLGIEIVSASEPFHTMKGSARVASEGAIRLVNEVYLAQVSENVKRGQDHVAARGYKTTWPPYGYEPRWVPDPSGAVNKRTGQPVLRLTWVLHREQAEVVRWLFNEYLEGNGFKALAMKLNEKGTAGPRGGSWAPSAIREMLRNQSYIGWFCLGKHSRIKGPDGKKRYIDNPMADWRIHRNAHEAIISQEVFDKVQQRMQRVAQNLHFSHAKADHSQYLLTGLIKCAECGANFVVQSTKIRAGEPPRYWHYICGQRRNRGASVCSNGQRIDMRALDGAVLEATEQKLLDPGMMDNVARQAERILEAARVDAYEAEGLEQEKRQVEKEIDRLTKVLAQADQAPDAASHFTEQIQQRQRRLKEINSTLDRPRKAQQKVARLMLPLFQNPQVAIKLVRKKDKSLKDWYGYLQEELGEWVEVFRQRSPVAVRDELKKHIRQILVHQDGKIVIQGTYQGILAEADLIEAGDLGTIEIEQEPREITNKKAPEADDSRGYTRQNGVPNGI